MPFVEQVMESFVMGLADGPTEVHKITLARQVLRDYKGTNGLFPSAIFRRCAKPQSRNSRDRIELEVARAMTTIAAVQYDFTDKVVVITGGSRGIGHAMALGFAKAGAKLAIASRKIDTCEADRQGNPRARQRRLGACGRTSANGRTAIGSLKKSMRAGAASTC